MAITRTPIFNDSGGGTDGTVIDNAWKQEFYDQIDAFGAVAAPVYGTWTPVDASGAGLAFVVAGTGYCRIDRAVFVSANLTYPTTSNSGQAIIGGLPFLCGAAPGGLYPVYGLSRIYFIPPGLTSIYPYNATTGVAFTNAQLSGSAVVIAGYYLI